LLPCFLGARADCLLECLHEWTVPSWLSDLRAHSDPSVVIILIGNKSDLDESDLPPAADSTTELSPTSTLPPSPTSSTDSPSSAPAATAASLSNSTREVSRREAEEFAKREGLFFLETSAKTGKGINEVSFSVDKSSAEGAHPFPGS
jgi:Ras-related protein Rab-2A